MTTICLLVLCGVPGAGKSTWVQQFKHYIKQASHYESEPCTRAAAPDEGGFCGVSNGSGEEEPRRAEEKQTIENKLFETMKEGREMMEAGMRYQVIHIAFDDLISEAMEAELVHDAKHHSQYGENVTWRMCRKAIAECVEHLVQECISCTRLQNTSFEAAAAGTVYQATDSANTRRRNLESQVSTKLSSLITDGVSSLHSIDTLDHSKRPVLSTGDCYKNSYTDDDNTAETEVSSLSSVCIEQSSLSARTTVMTEGLKNKFEELVRQQRKELNSCYWILVVDDNMYYSNMTGFAQIYFPVELVTALQRNQMRKRQVEDSVICEMFRRLEKPSTDNLWERTTATWNEEDTSQGNFQKVLHLINEAISNQPMSVSIDSTQQDAEESRIICSTSLLHQADVILRKVLRLHITESRCVTKNKAELSLLAVRCNSVRHQILSDLRSQKILIPHHLVMEIHSASADEENPFHLFLKDIFLHLLMLFDCSL